MIRGLGRLLLAAAFCSLFFLPMAAVQAAPTTMTVCGVSSQGSEQGAIANARKKAMFKALRYLITPQNPLFRQLMGEYEQYTAQPQVFNQQKDGSKLLLYSKVTVDMDKLTARIGQVNAAQTERHDDKAFYCLIRVNGMAMDAAHFQSSQSQLATVYKDVFERLGFQMADQADLSRSIMDNRQPFETFCQSLSQRIETDHQDVPLAIIGEVSIRPVTDDATGHTCQGDVIVRAVDIYNGRRVIGEYRDSYQLVLEEKRLTGQRVLDKAGLNSARALADKVAAYWQQH